MNRSDRLGSCILSIFFDLFCHIGIHRHFVDIGNCVIANLVNIDSCGARVHGRYRIIFRLCNLSFQFCFSIIKDVCILDFFQFGCYCVIYDICCLSPCGISIFFNFICHIGIDSHFVDGDNRIIASFIDF